MGFGRKNLNKNAGKRLAAISVAAVLFLLTVVSRFLWPLPSTVILGIFFLVYSGYLLSLLLFGDKAVTIAVNILSASLLFCSVAMSDEATRYLSRPVSVVCSNELSDDYIARKVSEVLFVSIIPLAICNFIFSYIRTRSETDVSVLQDKNEQQQNALEDCESHMITLAENVRAMINGYLMLTAGRLEFGDKATNNERITMYVLDEPAKKFVNCGRFSANPKYQSVGRVTYPRDQGCIAKAYNNGQAFFDNLPCPVNENGDYREWHSSKEQGIKKSDCDNFAMKSRLYFGQRIDCAVSGQPLAVIIIESDDTKRYSFTELQDAFDNNTLRHFEIFVRNVRPFIPLQTIAEEKGF